MCKQCVSVCVCVRIPSVPFFTALLFFQLPSLDCLTPRASVCLPHLCLSSSTVTWWDSVSRWLLMQPAEVASSLEPLLQHLLPPCMEFLTPVLCGDIHVSGDRGGVSEQSASSLGETQKVHLCPQNLRLHPTHLVNTCCRILEVSQYNHTCRVVMYVTWFRVWCLVV